MANPGANYRDKRKQQYECRRLRRDNVELAALIGGERKPIGYSGLEEKSERRWSQRVLPQRVRSVGEPEGVVGRVHAQRRIPPRSGRTREWIGRVEFGEQGSVHRVVANLAIRFCADPQRI